MSCTLCQYYLEREQGVHETYIAGICTFNEREKWIASEVDGMIIVKTPKWCPLKSKVHESNFMRNSKPLDTTPWKDPYE